MVRDHRGPRGHNPRSREQESRSGLHRGEGVRPRGSPDHLIGQEEQGWGYRDPERLGGLEVEDQLEFYGLFHREIGRLGAFEDFVHVGRCASIQGYIAGAIGDEAAHLGKLHRTAHGREPVCGRKVQDASVMGRGERIPRREWRRRPI
jgi:hypothetical protein